MNNWEKALPWEVAANGLCVRCGACSGSCPKSLIVLDERNFPKLNKEAGECIRCGVCMTACPGEELDLCGLSVSLLDRASSSSEILGIYRDAIIAYSNNDEIRHYSASGGVVTQLLATLLENGTIQRALVAGMSRDEPWKGEPLLASTTEEVIGCAQSKYTIVPQMRLLGALLKWKTETAVVGLPCHIHALRKFQSAHPGKLDHVKFVIGLFCHMALEIEATEMLLRKARISKSDLDTIEYRGGDWPGKILAKLKDGSVKPLHAFDFKDGAINYLKYLYYPSRCLLCIDFSAELADIAVGDPWLRGKDGRYIYERGHSLVLVRTEKGDQLIKMASALGDLRVEAAPTHLFPSRFRDMYVHKKMGAGIRIESLKRKGLPYPHYQADLPVGRAGERLVETLHGLARILGRSESGRKLGSMIAFSWFGRILTVVRRWRKELMARI